MKAPCGSKGTYSSTLSLTSAVDWGGCSMPRFRPLQPRKRDPVPWTDAEYRALNGTRSPDRLDRSESHRLSYPGPAEYLYVF